LPAEQRYNAETLAALQEAQDIMDGKIKAKVYHSLADFYADLDAEPDDDEG
jgi:hypothetical protein